MPKNVDSAAAYVPRDGTLEKRPSGKRRLHQKPDGGEIDRCRPWLSAELRVIRPRVIVAMGATAARSVVGRNVTIGRARGRRITSPEGEVVVTYHPSAVLRAPDDAARQALFALLVEDLRLAGEALAA